MENDAQIYINDEWLDIQFSDIKEGNKFRLFYEGELVENDNDESEFIATSDAFQDEDDNWKIIIK